MLRRGLIAAAIFAGSAGASAQTEKLPEARAVPQTQAPLLPGVASTKVKVMRLDSKGHVLPGTSPAPVAAGQSEKAGATLGMPPPLKVPVYRVEPNGRMHAPNDAER